MSTIHTDRGQTSYSNISHRLQPGNVGLITIDPAPPAESSEYQGHSGGTVRVRHLQAAKVDSGPY
jgi:hypothetical protein